MTPEEQNEMEKHFEKVLREMEEALERMVMEIEKERKAFQEVETPRMKAMLCLN